MRLTILARTIALAACAALLAGCSSTGDGPTSGLGQSFDLNNYRRSNDINGTQTRPDVYGKFTQPAIPTIVNRGN